MRNNKIKLFRLISLFLTVILLSGVILSCNSEENDSNTLNNNQESQEEGSDNSAETVTDTTEISDDLPDRDFGGRDFVILTRGPYGWDTCHHMDEFYVESENGDVINDAVYKRNRLIEDRFNVNIKIQIADEVSNAMRGVIKNMVKAGDDAVDLVCDHQIYMATTAADGYFLNWFDIPGVNFDKPWWIQDANTELSVDGKALFAISEIAYELLDYTYCVYFNKKLVADYALEDPYKVVNEGRWTLDYVYQTTKDIYADVDNDGKATSNDFYGFASNTYSAGNTFLWSLGGKVMEKDADGRPQLVMNNQHTIDIIDKLYTLYFETPGVFALNATTDPTSKMEWPYVTSHMFKNSGTIFSTGMFCDAVVRFKDMTDDYGIIPYPKWDESQDKYYTMIDGHGPLLAVLTTEQDTEFVGIITEAMSAESYKLVTPAYYEVALKNKYSRDEESVKMLDLIKSGIKYDFGYIYDGWNGFAFSLQDLFSQKKKDFASYYEKKEKAALKYYNKIIDMYYELEN